VYVRDVRYVALLRGINVGGHNKVAMADLRAVVTGLGHTDVATYIQSGNVLFTSDEADTEVLGTALEEAITRSLGVKPSVIVLSREELARVVRDTPYPDEPNPKLVHAVFFRGPVPPGSAEAIEAGQRRAAERGSGRDSARIVGPTVYVHTPDGFGRSDTRESLRRHFETDAEHVVVATLHALHQDDKLPADVVAKAIQEYHLSPDAPDPREA